MGPPAPEVPRPDRKRRLVGRAGSGLFAFGIFLSGWMGMRTNDWRQMVLWIVVASGCAWFASRLAAWSR